LTVAALFVQNPGIYTELLPAELCWDEARDAHTYVGPHPVVAHPPCQLWVNLAAVNWKRYKRELPAWYPGGGDRGGFARAVSAVMAWGGVLEHPAGSHAFGHYGIAPPIGPGWRHCINDFAPACRLREYWVCEVWQSTYDNPARKRTWLVYCGKRPPFELDWRRQPGTHQVGWFDRNKPTLSKKAASATPRAFAEELIRLAEWSRGTP
jgi:hypothetical protein